MNAAVASLDLIEAAFKKVAMSFAGQFVDKNYKMSVHIYNDEHGQEVFRRVRVKHPDTGDKQIRPFHLAEGKWRVGEPKAPPNGKSLYGRQFLARNSDDPIYVVEGESPCEALWNKGLLATTSGGATSATSADWSPLAKRQVIIWPDNDAPGLGYRDAVIEKLAPLGCTITVIDLGALNLKDGDDAVDWLKRNPEASADDIEGLSRLDPSEFKNSGNSKNSSAPEQLRRSTSPPEPYPVACLGDILAPACGSLQRVIQAPDSICGASLLAAASLAVQGLADVENDGRVHLLSLWMLSVAESGERKSAIDKEAMRPVRERERTLFADYGFAKEGHDAELEEWTARRGKLKTEAGKGDGSGLAEALRELGPAPPEPLRPVLTVADFTAEGIAKLLAVGRPSVGAFTDEAALVFGGHGMTKETVARTAATLCKLWDCGELDRVRAGDGPMKLWGRRLSMHLLAQPVIAERALSDTVLSGQGFLPRCLLAWSQGTAGTRLYKSERLIDDPALVRYCGRLAQLLEKPLPYADRQRNELSPRLLRLTPEAFEAWRKVHDVIESAMSPDGKYAVVKPWASKTPEQCLRIAGVLRLVEKPDADAIDDATIDRAAELALWHLNEAVRLAGTAAVSEDIRHAEALLNWCHTTGRSFVYSTDALQLGPNIIRDANIFREAIGALERTGWASKVDGGMIIDERHRKYVWRIEKRGGAQ